MEDIEQPAKKSRDIADAIREETSRGKRGPASLAARKRRVEMERKFRKLLERGTEAEFCAAMHAIGVEADSQQFRRALRIWRENRLL
jgi:hypothetical protein